MTYSNANFQEPKNLILWFFAHTSVDVMRNLFAVQFELSSHPFSPSIVSRCVILHLYWAWLSFFVSWSTTEDSFLGGWSKISSTFNVFITTNSHLIISIPIYLQYTWSHLTILLFKSALLGFITYFIAV